MFRLILIYVILLGCSAYSQISLPDSSGARNVFITSDPSESSVFINDSLIGKTPLILFDTPRKPFLLKLIDNLQNKWSMTVGDVNSKSLRIHALINKQYAQLAVFSDPAGANVIINDSLVGKTPLGPLEIPLGLVKIRLEKENYFSYEEAVVIPKSMPVLYQVKARLKSIYSSADLSALSSFNNIYLDGTKINSEEVKLRKLIVGDHNIRVDSGGTERSLSIDFSISSDSISYVYMKHNQFNSAPLLLSLAIPGSGQVYDGSIKKGAYIFSAFAALGAAAYFTSDNYSRKLRIYDQQRIAYLNSKSEMEARANKDYMISAKDESDKALKFKQAATGLLIGTYLYNIIDILFFHSSKDILDVKKHSYGIDLSSSAATDARGTNLSIKLNF